MWYSIKRFFRNLFTSSEPQPTTPNTVKPIEVTVPVSHPVESKIPVKGWFPEYDEIIKKELKGKTHLLDFSRDTDYWICFFKAVAKAESNLDPFNTYWERNLNGGVDPITGMKYLSEGLLQLSYVDAKWHGCPFCIDTDRDKKSDDKTKTIFNPENNLKCGVIILNKLMKKHKTPFWNKGHYWAVLKPSNSRHKVFKMYLNKYLEEVMNV